MNIGHESAETIEIIAVDHVQLGMPSGGEDRARVFYGGALGLREIVKPTALVGRGGVWFAGGPGLAVHLSVEAGERPVKSHPAFVVADLAVARLVLAAAGVAIEEDDSGLSVARCYVRDPFGNRIELVDAADAGFSER